MGFLVSSSWLFLYPILAHTLPSTMLSSILPASLCRLPSSQETVLPLLFFHVLPITSFSPPPSPAPFRPLPLSRPVFTLTHTQAWYNCGDVTALFLSLWGTSTQSTTVDTQVYILTSCAWEFPLPSLPWQHLLSIFWWCCCCSCFRCFYVGHSDCSEMIKAASGCIFLITKDAE